MDYELYLESNYCLLSFYELYIHNTEGSWCFTMGLDMGIRNVLDSNSVNCNYLLYLLLYKHLDFYYCKYLFIYTNDKKNMNNILEDLKDLLTEVISDLYKTRGAVQLRHSYILYRNKIMDIRRYYCKNVLESNDISQRYVRANNRLETTHVWTKELQKKADELGIKLTEIDEKEFFIESINNLKETAL